MITASPMVRLRRAISLMTRTGTRTEPDYLRGFWSPSKRYLPGGVCIWFAQTEVCRARFDAAGAAWVAACRQTRSRAMRALSPVNFLRRWKSRVQLIPDYQVNVRNLCCSLQISLGGTEDWKFKMWLGTSRKTRRNPKSTIWTSPKTTVDIGNIAVS